MGWLSLLRWLGCGRVGRGGWVVGVVGVVGVVEVVRVVEVARVVEVGKVTRAV